MRRREKLFLYHLWQTGDYIGWAIMTETEAFLAAHRLSAGQQWRKVEYYGMA